MARPYQSNQYLCYKVDPGLQKQLGLMQCDGTCLGGLLCAEWERVSPIPCETWEIPK